MYCKSIINFNTGSTCDELAMNVMQYKSDEHSAARVEHYPLCEHHYKQYNQESLAHEIEPGRLQCTRKPRGVLRGNTDSAKHYNTASAEHYNQGLDETIELHRQTNTIDTTIDTLYVDVPEYLKPIHQYAKRINREEAESEAQTSLEPFIIGDSSYEIVEDSNEEDVLSNYANGSDIPGPLKSDETIDYIGKTLGKIVGIPDFVVEGLLSSLKEDEVLRQARYSIESKKSFLSMNPLLKIHPDDSSYLIIAKRIGQIVLNKWLNLMNSRSATTVIETKTLTRPTSNTPSNHPPNHPPKEVSINLRGLMNKTTYTAPHVNPIEANNNVTTEHHMIAEPSTSNMKLDNNTANAKHHTVSKSNRTGLMNFLNKTNS